MSQCVLVKQHVEKILQYLEQFLPFVNCHMVDYFTESLYVAHIPNYIREEIEGVGFEKAINAVFEDSCNGDTHNLNDYIKQAQKFSLCNLQEVCLTASEFRRKLTQAGCEDIASLKLEVFMKPKKSHEVEVLSAVAASLRKIGKTSHVIDIGDGRGYLSSMLALHYGIPVLGIDSSLTKTSSAVRRAEKLGRIWHGIVKSPKRSALPLDEQNRNRDTLLYKQVTQFVTESTSFKQLVSDVFLENAESFSLVGLHTCGNLAPTSVRIFAGNEDVKTICNVSCCYHLLTESGENAGFPMSNFLTGKCFKLGRNARMLSAQSIDRILTKKELPKRNIFYRAVFEVLLREHCEELPTRNVGKFHKGCDNFVDYVREAAHRLQVHISTTDREIVELLDFYAARESELYLFNLLRCLMAPVIESLILLDRLLYLQEQGFSDSFLVRLFNPVISPRCYGLIALKNA